MMKLKVGKHYKHKLNGIYLSVVGKVRTTTWDEILIGESPDSDDSLIPLDPDIETDEWEEIDEEEWLTSFDEASEEETKKTND